MDGVIKRAIENNQPLQIIYLDGKQRITQRNVRPYAIINHRLKAFCFLRNQIRLFSLDSILAAYPLNTIHKSS